MSPNPVVGGPHPEGDEPSRPSPSHNQSVLKAMALLRCFVDSTDGLTLTQLARRTGINVSTAYRMLQTLTVGGLLARTDGSERYVPGPVLLALAGSTFAASGYEQALSVLRGLAERTGESTSLGIRDGECAVIILGAESSQPLRFGHAIGSRLPLHALALGKALLAFGPLTGDDPVESILPLRPLTPRTILSENALRADLSETARRGYAVATEEEHIGVRSVAVPIGAPGGAPRAAVSVQGPLGRLPDSRLEEIAADLRDVASLLSQLPVLNWISPGT